MVGLSPSRKSCHGCRFEFEETAVGSPATAEPVVDPSWKIFVRALIHSLSCPPPQSYTGLTQHSLGIMVFPILCARGEGKQRNPFLFCW